MSAMMMSATRPPAAIPAYFPILEVTPELEEVEVDEPARRVDSVDMVILGVEVVLFDP